MGQSIGFIEASMVLGEIGEHSGALSLPACVLSLTQTPPEETAKKVGIGELRPSWSARR